MATKKPNFAVDLTPEGVNLWQRGHSDDWLGLGFVPKSADNFTQAIESARMNADQRDQIAAEIRVAKSEVYFTTIPADQVPEKRTDAAILAVIGSRIPFRDKTARLIVDTCLRGSGDLAVAVVPAPVLEEATEFALRHGFDPSYFTTLNNPMMFPAEPRFRLAEPARPLPALKPAPNRRKVAAIAAAIAIAIAGLAVVGGALLGPSQSAVVVADGNIVAPGAYPAPASGDLPDLHLPQPGAIAAERSGPTPAFAADVGAPKTRPEQDLQIAVAPDIDTPEIVGFHPQPRREKQQVSVRKGIEAESEFEPSGMATRTRRLLDNSFISIEEPESGEIGRKTIRILPSDLGKGSRYNRFDPRSFVRVAQAQIANDASSGLPDVENDLLRVNEAGVPLFEGAPAAVPPPHPGTASSATGTAAADASLKAFSEGVAQVLDTADADPDVSGIQVRKASLGSIRPRPNPFRKQEPEAAAAQPDVSVPVQTASAATLRPKPRPASLEAKIRQMHINAAAELAASEAIRENMPTKNAVFVSLLPKPRPAHLNKSVVRSLPGLTASRKSSTAVVRAAPAGGGKSTRTMTTSDTPKSVAALATDTARLPKHSLSLIGVFGSSSSRRALLRLKTGRYVKVKQGDNIGGWKVSAIGENSVRINKGSRDEVLRMPE